MLFFGQKGAPPPTATITTVMVAVEFAGKPETTTNYKETKEEHKDLLGEEGAAEMEEDSTVNSRPCGGPLPGSICRKIRKPSRNILSKSYQPRKGKKQLTIGHCFCLL